MGCSKSRVLGQYCTVPMNDRTRTEHSKYFCCLVLSTLVHLEEVTHRSALSVFQGLQRHHPEPPMGEQRAPVGCSGGESLCPQALAYPGSPLQATPAPCLMQHNGKEGNPQIKMPIKVRSEERRLILFLLSYRTPK